MGLSKTSEKCKQCELFLTCDNKTLEACAYLKNESMIRPASETLTQAVLSDMAVKHDYRDVKIAEGTTITIDLEDVKKQIYKDLRKTIMFPGG